MVLELPSQEPAVSWLIPAGMRVKVTPEHGLKTGRVGRSPGNIAARMWNAMVPDGYFLVNAEKLKP
jgi:hypothetical protein